MSQHEALITPLVVRPWNELPCVPSSVVPHVPQQWLILNDSHNYWQYCRHSRKRSCPLGRKKSPLGLKRLKSLFAGGDGRPSHGLQWEHLRGQYSASVLTGPSKSHRTNPLLVLSNILWTSVNLPFSHDRLISYVTADQTAREANKWLRQFVKSY